MLFCILSFLVWSFDVVFGRVWCFVFGDGKWIRVYFFCIDFGIII